MAADPTHELDEYLDDVFRPAAASDGGDAQSGGWVPDSEDEADWALRKLRAAARKAQERRELVAARREALDRYEAEVIAPLDDEAERWRGLLELWMLSRLERDPKASRTVKLPSGEVKARKAAGRVEVEDEETLVPWLEDAFPGLVRVKTSPDRAGMKKAIGDGDDAWTVTDDGTVVTAEGEVVPGVRYVEPDRPHVTATPDMDGA